MGCGNAIAKPKQLPSPSAKAPLTSLQLYMGQCPHFSLLQVSQLACPALSLPWEGGLGSGRDPRLMPWQCAGWVEQLSGESKRKSVKWKKICFREQGHWSATWVGLGKRCREEGGSFSRVSDTAPVQVPSA